MKKYFLAIVAALLLGFTVQSNAQSTHQTADEILATAVQQAKQQNKKVLLIFHASWCGWCKKMDAAIEDKACKAYFDKNFIITHVTVLEQGKNVSLNTQGGMNMMIKYGGENQGIPFWLIFDEYGQLLANSKLPVEGQPEDQWKNVGCPARTEEVNYFISLLKKHTPITDAEAQAISTRFAKNGM